MLIDPIAFWLGSLPIRWYGISYSIGISLAWICAKSILDAFPSIKRKDIDDFVVWSVFAIIIGGRLGHVILYDMAKYMQNPSEILCTWNGGMSFHGGLLGISIAGTIFCIKRKIQFVDMADCLACIAPIGIFFGRIANFINQELYGRLTTAPWAVRFDMIDSLPRHPSQLYEAFLEGPVLFAITLFIARQRPRGPVCGWFLLGYASFRFLCECFKEPIEISTIGITLGQMYSIPMLLMGFFIILYRKN